MTHAEFKSRFASGAGPFVNRDAMLFQYCLAISATEFRWYRAEIGGKNAFFEIQDGGTLWKLVQYDHADQFTISVGGLFQNIVYYAIPITEQEFNRVLRQAMGRLLRTSK